MKKWIWIITSVFALITFYYIADTYALFETNAQAKLTNPLGQWNITINDTDITSDYTSEYTIDNFVYEENASIIDDKIAPGRKGYFDIIIDPSNTDVAIKYEINISDEVDQYKENIYYSLETLDGSTIIKNNDKQYIGLISLDKINNKEKLTIRVRINWDNISDYDIDDYELGSSYNNSLSMPISIRFSQYLGEELSPSI